MASVDRDSVEDMLAQIGTRFDELLKGPDFLITNDSMGHLLRLYWDDLLSAWQDEDEEALMKTWRKDLPEFRAAWLEIATKDVLTFRDTKRAVVTESATFGAREHCGRRKERRRPPRRR